MLLPRLVLLRHAVKHHLQRTFYVIRLDIATGDGVVHHGAHLVAVREGIVRHELVDESNRGSGVELLKRLGQEQDDVLQRLEHLRLLLDLLALLVHRIRGAEDARGELAVHRRLPHLRLHHVPSPGADNGVEGYEIVRAGFLGLRDATNDEFTAARGPQHT